jgi:2-methylcitrate dehydratase
MVVSENPAFTKDYFDPEKRYIGNAVEVFFKDGTSTGQVSIDYPIGHRKRRDEGIPVLLAKAEKALRAHLPAAQADRLVALAGAPEEMDAMSISDFIDLYRV